MNDNGENRRSLPDGWEMVVLGDVVKFQKGKKPDVLAEEATTGFLPYVDIQAFEEKTVRKFGNPQKAVFVEAGEIMLVWDGARAGLVGKSIRGLVGSTLSLVKPLEDINRDFLYYFLQSYYHEINTNTKGIGIPHVNPVYLTSLPFPRAPFPEQERIVIRIEELLSDLDAGVAALERARIGLQRYKASVLKAAITGRLLNGIVEIGDDELPEGWWWARAEDICGFITKGTTPKSDKLFAGSGDVPFIKVYNLTFDGSLDFSINPTFVSKETHSGELARSKIIPGDVLMNIVGPPLGKVSIVPDTFPEWNMNQAVARFRPLEICDRKYLSIALRTESVLSWAVKRAKATAGQFNLTLEICRNLPIPLPPLEEQRRIVAEVERRLSVVGEVESAVEVGLVRAGRLRQSVLRSAFEGRL